VCTNNAEVGSAFSRGIGGYRDEKHGVGPGRSGGSLGQSVDLSGVGLCPEVTIRAFAKDRVFGKFPCVGIEGVAMQGGLVECGPGLGALGG